MAFSTFMMLSNHHLCPAPGHFITPKGKPVLTQQSLPLIPSPVSLATTFCLYGFANSGHFI